MAAQGLHDMIARMRAARVTASAAPQGAPLDLQSAPLLQERELKEGDEYDDESYVAAEFGMRLPSDLGRTVIAALQEPSIVLSGHGPIPELGSCAHSYGSTKPEKSVDKGAESGEENAQPEADGVAEAKDVATPDVTDAAAVREDDAVHVKLTPEEEHILRWFRETHTQAKDAIKSAADGEYVWVDMSTGSEAVVVEMTQQRMRDIGMVLADGAPPTAEDPSRLFWVQDKPAEHKGQFGLWNPVGAQWCMYTGHTVVPVEQRIAPAGMGYEPVREGDAQTFTADDFKHDYTDTALEPALPHIVTQIKALGDVRVPLTSGWASSDDETTHYYTPHLRHLQIDARVANTPGKKYLYKWPSLEATVRLEFCGATGTWNETNTCWVYKTDIAQRAAHAESCCDACPKCDERGRDAAMAAQ